MLRVTVILTLLMSVLGHGTVYDPPSRASAWRFGFQTKPNYDDTGVNCGGWGQQYLVNGGKCGICGDAYNMKPPRPHELGGIYGDGIIVETYQPGSIISTTIDITAYHAGYWEFKLCPDPFNNDQDCFDKYPLELQNGGTKFYPNNGISLYQVKYKLPPGLVCNHCVLQWRYTAGNNWGVCKNGTEGLGCGNQEQFGACSDISITDANINDVYQDYDKGSPVHSYLFKKGLIDLQQGILQLLRREELTRPRKKHRLKTKSARKPRKHKHRNKKKIRKKEKKKSGSFRM